MKKIELVLRENEFTSFTSYYLEEFWRRWFDIKIYQPDATYDRTAVFAVWWMNARDDYVVQLQSQGRKVMVDYLWEYPMEHDDGLYWIQYADWARLNESLWWSALGYSRYVPNKKISHLAFMPMRRSSQARDRLFATMEPLLDRFIWSYRDRPLPDDGDSSHGEWQRFMNPSWYDRCFGSIVAETDTRTVWITEKSFKPIAYHHPYVIFAAPGHLGRIRELGFETFDNIFDESYDTESDIETRCKILYENARRMDSSTYDAETQRKLQHNHHHFFNQALVETMIQQQIVEPILNYANSQ